jgi:hypothetical protein
MFIMILRTLAFVFTVLAFVFIIKNDWLVSSIMWNITAGCLWFSLYIKENKDN